MELLEERKEIRKQERKDAREERKKEEKRIKFKKIENQDELENQITINLGEDKKIRKYDHSGENLEPVKFNKKEELNPNHIEANLFKQQEEVKETKTKEVLTLEHTLTVEDEDYEFPPLQILSEGAKKALKGGKKAVTDTATKLQRTLYSFGVSAKVENVSVGPAITRYELKPAEGVRVSKIAKLADDIALNLAAESIRIEAPIPGKQAVGIEIPNKENEMVHLRDILEAEDFISHKSKLAFALGKNVAGEEVVTDIAKMPHVLIAGATGSGKSVCINTLITSIIYKAKPSEVKLVMVDPKVVELSVYNGIPHLLIPVVTDPKKAAGALAWAVQEMTNRYSLFAKKGVRDIKGYNEALEKEEGSQKLPQIVIIIDELADLMMVAPNDVEDAICRLAQMARAAGMHLVIATQRPSVDVITGIIKANIPSRIAFAVSSQVDSRTILDMAGAEKLLGKGDMLFYPSGVPKPIRVQGAFVSDKEVEKIVDFLKSNSGETNYNEDILDSIEKANSTDKEIDQRDDDDDTDPFLMEAIEVVVETRQASTSFIQRRFKVGYARAGRIIDQMEERGVISGYQGSKPREVLMTKERWQELKMQPQVENNNSDEE
ncbi:MAG: DNA translocase FtsK [Clostridia bacterium]|nr:DNA translocase FtsK [Clostridia bacterium]